VGDFLASHVKLGPSTKAKRSEIGISSWIVCRATSGACRWLMFRRVLFWMKKLSCFFSEPPLGESVSKMQSPPVIAPVGIPPQCPGFKRTLVFPRAGVLFRSRKEVIPGNSAKIRRGLADATEAQSVQKRHTHCSFLAMCAEKSGWLPCFETMSFGSIFASRKIFARTRCCHSPSE
jgi:hypothetical protein